MNEQWKNAYREGFADGYAAAKKEMNYTNFPPLYWNNGLPVTSVGTIPGYDPKSSVSSMKGTPTGGLSYSINQPDQHFVTGMSVSSSDC